MQSATVELLFALGASNRGVREKALVRLAAAPDPDAAPELRRFAEGAGAVGDERALAYRALAAALTPAHTEEANFLLRQRSDPDPFVRAAVIDGLARLPDPRLSALFELGARDKDETVRTAAHRALAARRAAGLGPAADPAGGRAAATPGADPAVARWLTQLASSDPAARAAGLRGLVARGAGAVGDLLPELGHPNKAARIGVAQALGMIGDRRALDSLMLHAQGARGGADAEVLAVVLRAAASLLSPADERHLPQLLALTRVGASPAADDPFVRAAAVEAIAHVPGPRSAAAALASLGDPADWVREAAAGCLARAIAPPAPELVPALAVKLRHAARPAVLVGLLSGLKVAYAPGGPLPRGVLARVRELLGHEAALVREAALWAADALLAPPGNAPPPVDDALLDALLERLNDSEADVRRQALELLADVVPPCWPADVQAIGALARSADARLARPALRVLARVGGFEATERLVEAASGPPGELTREATRLLGGLTGPVRARQEPGGEWTAELAASCACGGQPRRRVGPRGREMIECPDCSTSYLLTSSGALEDVESFPHGICRCCRRPVPLTSESDGRLRCATSSEEYLRDPDTGIVYLAAGHPRGGCSCCVPPAPLLESSEGIVRCPSTGQTHRPRPDGGYRLAPATPAPRRLAAQHLPDDASPSGPPPSISDVNRALLEGSLLLTESGLPTEAPGD